MLLVIACENCFYYNTHFAFAHLKVVCNFVVMSSLTHWLFRSVSFNFVIFANFPKFPRLLISNFIHCGQKYSLYGFNLLKFIEMCFVA